MPSYQAALERFDGVKTQVLGLSVDSEPCLCAWAESLGGITYPLLSDFYPHGMVSQLYGVLRPDGKSERAIFVIDKTGIIRYIDIHDIDDQPDNEVLFVVLEELEPEASAEYKILMQKYQTDPLPDADVVIYCTPWCPDCRTLREYLNDCSVPFQEIDISRNIAAARLVREWAAGKEVTPVIKVRNSDVIVEFDRPRLDAALEKLHVLP